MPTIDDIRKAWGPQYDGLSDYEIAEYTAKEWGVSPVRAMLDLGVAIPKTSSNAGWEWEGAKSHYLSNMARLGGALGIQSAEDYANRMESQGNWERAQSTAPTKWDEMQFGDSEKGFLPYLRQGALGSAPYFAEALGYAGAEALSGGTATPAILARLGMRGAVEAAARPLAERAAAKATATATSEIAARRAAGEAITDELAATAIRQAAETAAQKASYGAMRGVGLTGVTYPSSVGDILSNQHEQSGEYNGLAAMGLGVPYAALNLLGGEGMINRGLGGLATGGVKRGLVAAGSTMAGESVNETGQEVMNQFGRMAVDPRAELFSPDAQERYKESAIMGGLIGGVAGSPHIASSALRPQVDPDKQMVTNLLDVGLAKTEQAQPSQQLALPAPVIRAEGDISQVPLARQDELLARQPDVAAMERRNEDLWNARKQHEQEARYDFNRQDSIPMPSTLGDAIGVMNAVSKSEHSPIIEGTPLHAAVLKAGEILDAHGMKYSPPSTVASDAVAAATQAEPKQPTKKEQKAAAQATKTADLVKQLDNMKASGEISPESHAVQTANANARKWASVTSFINKVQKDKTNAAATQATVLPQTAEQSLQGASNASVGKGKNVNAKGAKAAGDAVSQTIQPGNAGVQGSVAPSTQSTQGEVNANQATEATLPALQEKAQPATGVSHELVTLEGRAKAAEAVRSSFTNREAEALKHYFGSSDLTAEQLHDLSQRLMAMREASHPNESERERERAVGEELEKIQEETGDNTQGSFSYAGKMMGVSKQRAQQLVNAALAKTERFREANGLTEDHHEGELHDALGISPEAASNHLNSVSPEEAAQAGLTYRGRTKGSSSDNATSANDDFNHEAGFDGSGATLAQDGEITGAEETRADAVDAIAQAEETAGEGNITESDTQLGTGEVNYDADGVVVTKGDLDQAAEQWRLSAGYDLPTSLRKEFAQLMRLYRAGAINDKQAKEHADDIQRRAESLRVGQNDSPNEDAASEKAASYGARSSGVRSAEVANTAKTKATPAGKTAPKVVTKKPRVDAAAKKLAAQWNALAAAQNLPTWEALTADQRSLILESPNAREEAVNEVVRQVTQTAKRQYHSVSDQNGDEYPTTEPTDEQQSKIEEIVAGLRDQGLDDLVDSVEWRIADPRSGFHAAHEPGIVIVHPNLLEGKDPLGAPLGMFDSAERLLAHELSHESDVTDGVSTSRRFQTVVEATIRRMKGNPLLRQVFEYPLENINESDFNFPAEFFAELMSAYYSKELTNILAHFAPEAYRFAEQYHELSRSDTDTQSVPESPKGQGPATGQRVTAQEAPKPNSRKRKAVSLYSEGSGKGTTKKSLEAALNKLFFTPARMAGIVSVYQTQAEAKAAGALSEDAPATVRGFTTPDGKVGLIAENIEQGKELGVALHEIGVHLGMEKLIGAANMKWLADRIDAWRQRNDNSVESRVAQWAYNKAINSSSGAEYTQEELIAYMVEGLVDAGINPQAAGTTEAHQWFRKLWAAAKAALRKIGFKNPNFSGQNLVDLAYGAANLELDGSWHGAAARFRNFNHSYMGTGEGAQAYGWGTYLAQREGIGRDYWKRDTGRKSTGSVEFDGKTYEVSSGDTDDWHKFEDALKAKYPKYKNAVMTIAEAMAEGVGKAELIRRSHTYGKGYEYEGARIREILKAVKTNDVEGSLMRVATNVRDHEFLDWDKPLKEQSDLVKSALGKNLIAEHGDKSGKDAYIFLGQTKGSDKAASEYLDSLGVKGIKFLDAQSRNAEKADVIPQVGANGSQEWVVSYQSATPADVKTFSSRDAAKEYAAKKQKELDSKQTNNLVIFNDKNVQRVATRVGARSDSGSIKFSQGSSFTNVTPQNLFHKIGDWAADPVGALSKVKLGMMTLKQIAERTKSEAVKTYDKIMTDMQQASKEIVSKGAHIDKAWVELEKKFPQANKSMMGIMRRATRMQFDPENAAPANADQQKLKQEFNALPQPAKDLYKSVRDFYVDRLAERRAIMEKLAQDAKDGGKRVKEVRRMFAEMKGPYFPLMRIGKWYSVGMSNEVKALRDKEAEGTLTADERKKLDALLVDEKHYVTQSFDTRREAIKSANEFKAKYGFAYHNTAKETMDYMVKSLPDMPRVEEVLSTGLDGVTRSQVKDLLTHMMYDMAPEHSALKRMMQRKGIAGENENMRRVFASSVLSQAHYISRLKHANALSDAKLKIDREGRYDENMRNVANELGARTQLAMNREDPSPVTSYLLNGSYFAHLGLSPAFMLTNMTQVPMIALPWLSARYGFSAASKEMARAYGDVAPLIVSSYKGGWLSEFKWDKGNLTGNEKKLFEAMSKSGSLDITIEHDLADVANTKQTKFGELVGSAVQHANAPVRITELANRGITGLMAYRLAVSKGMSHEAAVQKAIEAVDTTQLNYNGLNAPRYMRSLLGSKDLARLSMQFRKYQQGMFYLVASSMRDAVKGETPEIRKQARDTVLGLYASTGLMAGALGMPFMGSLMWMATAVASMFGDKDDPWDAEVWFRNFMADMFGDELGAAVSKGAPMLLGVDLSKRVGMGDLASPLPFFKQGKTGTETVGNLYASALGGASAGTIADIYDGLSLMAHGQFEKGLEKVVPLKAASNLIRAHRYATEGLSNKNGETILPDESFNIWDLALRGAGFATTKESEYYAANAAVEDAKKAATDVRSELLRGYAQAKLKGDDTSRFEEKIADFNTRHPEKGIKIDASSKLKAVQARRKMSAERNEAGIRISKQSKPFIEAGAFAY